MNHLQALQAVEALRLGIPPDGFVTHFTVGRTSEIAALEQHLQQERQGSLLLRANYGSGKTHLLRLARERALEKGFVVSSVTLDSQSGVRFNRMDQILGAVARGVKVPDYEGQGIGYLLQAVSDRIDEEGAENEQSYWYRLSKGWTWSHSNILGSPALYIALRAWYWGDKAVKALVEDWLSYPWNYYNQRTALVDGLVVEMQRHFRDSRSPRYLFNPQRNIFTFQADGYAQSWSALADLYQLVVECGYRGLVLLFDEFEDAILALNNSRYRESAFINLFRFFRGSAFPGNAFFAVTPRFADTCRHLLVTHQGQDFDAGHFERLPTLHMSPLETEDLIHLSIEITRAHGVAYGWEPLRDVSAASILQIVLDGNTVPAQDRTRSVIRQVVASLDEWLEGIE